MFDSRSDDPTDSWCPYWIDLGNGETQRFPSYHNAYAHSLRNKRAPIWFDDETGTHPCTHLNGQERYTGRDPKKAVVIHWECPPDHKHAETVTCRNNHGCRCTPCMDAYNARNSVSQKHRRRMKAYGRWVGRIDATGTVRRIRGLNLLGWSNEHIAELSGGLSRESVRLTTTRTQVTQEVAERIERVTNVLVARGTGPSAISRARAERAGYVPLFAWDSIDTDPEPATVEHIPGVDEIAVDLTMTGQRVHLTRDDKLEAVRRMTHSGWGRWRICETLRINTITLDQMLKEVA